MNDHIAAIKQAVVAGRHQEIQAMVQSAIDSGVDLDLLINESLIGAMDIVGQRFASSEIFVPEMLVSAVTMKKGLELIKPLLTGTGSQSKGTILIGTVKGDLHDIGKNLVVMMLKGAGFEVADVGVDVSPDDFVTKAKESGTQIVGLSALLTTTMPAMEKTIAALKEAGLAVKTMIGGAPVTQGYADKIGADGYAPDAASAVDLAKSLLN